MKKKEGKKENEEEEWYTKTRRAKDEKNNKKHQKKTTIWRGYVAIARKKVKFPLMSSWKKKSTKHTNLRSSISLHIVLYDRAHRNYWKHGKILETRDDMELLVIGGLKEEKE